MKLILLHAGRDDGGDAVGPRVPHIRGTAPPAQDHAVRRQGR